MPEYFFKLKQFKNKYTCVQSGHSVSFNCYVKQSYFLEFLYMYGDKEGGNESNGGSKKR